MIAEVYATLETVLNRGGGGMAFEIRIACVGVTKERFDGAL